SPVIDVQNAKREVVMSNDTIEALPLTRAAGALLNATPGLFVDTNGPALSPTMTFFNARSSTTNSTLLAGEGRVTINGMTVAAGGWSRGNNLSDDLKAQNPNLTQTPGIIRAYDASGSYGGPIKKDRLWFFASYRNLDTQTAMEGISANANAGDPSRWDWVGSPINARLVQDRQMIIGRLTAQLGTSRISFNSEY